MLAEEVSKYVLLGLAGLVGLVFVLVGLKSMFWPKDPIFTNPSKFVPRNESGESWLRV